MNKKQSTEAFSTRLIPMAESSKLDDSRRNYSSEFAAGYHHSMKKKADLSDQSIVSPISTLNTSSYTPGRSTIDAQTYVDAQSNGFTSRIVRYEEENKKKSKVYNRMYKRPGDFPIVHLDKPKLVLNTKRSIVNPPKMARIGQPEPSIYRANIRAEILRNGTLMPQISVDRREDVDSAILRVDPLDALKEISRKRIHCEDTINQKQIGPTEKDSTDSVPSGTTFNNSKRQRINHSSSENNKRGLNFSKSNEIFSSLSSSSYMLSPPSSPSKRVETTSPSNAVAPPQSKRLQPEKSIEPPTIDTSIGPSIRPSIKSVPKTNDVVVPKVVETSYPTESTRPKLTLFNRPYSASVLPPVSIDRNDRDDECNITFVKPRPMTARSRESVENWLKIKPDEKKRLSLMLSCLSGELDDGDTVDSTEKEQASVSTVVASNQNVPIDCPPKDFEIKKDAPVINIPASDSSVSSTAQSNLNSTITLSSIAKPTISFTPLVNASAQQITKAADETKTTTEQVAPVAPVEERKGGFSFPMPTKVAPQNQQAVITPIVSASSTVTPVSTTLAPVLPIVTQSSSIEPSTKTTTEEEKDSTVTYTFQIPKQKTTSSTLGTNVEATKGFTFGNNSSETKSTPAFGLSNTAKLSEPQSLSTPSVDPKKLSGSGDTPKSNSFAVFGQSISAATSVEFGKNTSTIPSTSTTVSTTLPLQPIFGTTPISNADALNKERTPSFGLISVNQQSLGLAKPTPPSMTSVFSKNEQTQIFGSASKNQQLDPRTSITSTTTAFTSNQPAKPATIASTGSTAPFTFGTPTTASSVFQTIPPNKPINPTTNIFGSSAAASANQGSTTSSIFGSTTNSSTNLFDQTSKMSSNSNPIQNLTEPAKTNSSNIFGSSAKPSSTFSFGNNNQPNPSNIFGGQAPTTGTFNFGGSKSNESSVSNSNMNKAFSFSGSSVETTKSMPFGSKSDAPTFGSSNTIDSKSFGFTSNNQPNANNLFNNNKSTNDVPKVFSFGNSSSAPAATNFGGASNTPSFGVASNTPSFGSINNTTSFGGAGTTPSFGSPSATLSFGGANASAKPTFGATSAMSTFGTTNATPGFRTTNANPVFGTSNVTSAFGTSNATPAFGTSNTTPAFGTTSASPAFGTTSATPAFGTTSATPAFGATTPNFGGNNTTPTFGNATPSFGGANSTPSFGSSGTQAFNGNNSTPTFGGVTPLNNSGAPVFGNSGTAAFITSTGTADINKTFNFTGNDPTPSPIPNLFNIGPGSSAPRGRTTRTATRRTYR